MPKNALCRKEFTNKDLGLQVRTISNEDGSISISVEDTAIGFGWTRVANSGNEVVRWERVNKYINEIDPSCPQVGMDDYIPESLFYRLGMKANNKVADAFQNWLAMEVIPSIRKHGAYMTDDTIEKALTEPDFLIRLATKLKEEKELRVKAEAQIEADKPKVLFADAVSVSSTTILIGDLAKLLKQNGIETGQKRLFEWLRENGYLIKHKGADYNSPTQYAMELGLFEVKETVVTHADGHTTISKTTKVTGKGQQYFINKFLQKKEE